ncbi:hypothetical protein LguiA_032754 [Lonicera macranthoides]
MDIRVTVPAMRNFVMQLPEKLQKSLKSHFKGLTKHNDRTKSRISLGNDKESSSTLLEINLEKQLQVWKENPTWVDQSPDIKVSVPKGSFCHLNVKVDVGLPPDAVYNIVTDPDNKRVFKNIKEVLSRKVLVDEGLHQVVEVDQAALWKFLWWSGTISVHVLVDQNRADYSMKFKQVKTGFMERFEGCWRVEPILVDEKSCLPFKPKTVADYISCTKGKGRVGSKVSLEQIIQPLIIPPPPISWYLRGITTRTTEMLITDLLAEAGRIREGSTSVPDISEGKELVKSEKILDEFSAHGICDIKRRWAKYIRL